MAVVMMMMVTSCDAVVEHGEDKEGGVEAGEDHQQVVERVPHAEKGHWLDIYDSTITIHILYCISFHLIMERHPQQVFWEPSSLSQFLVLLLIIHPHSKTSITKCPRQ